MHCEGKLKLRSHNISYCLIEVVTKAGLTVYKNKGFYLIPNHFKFNGKNNTLQHFKII